MEKQSSLFQSRLLRVPAALFGASLISFALFVMMGHMIASDAEASTQPPPVSIVFGEVDYPEETITNPPVKHEPPELIQPPARPENIGSDSTSDTRIDRERLQLAPGGPNMIGTPGGDTRGVLNNRPDHTPWPDYPMNARRAGIEGYVVVELTLDAMGRVAHARVVESQPARVFDQAALSAAQRWSLPSAADGSSRVIQRRIDFSID